MQIGERYRHYKGHYYKILQVNAHYEPSLEPVIIYQHEETGNIWVRPKNSFLSEVIGNGLPVGTKRFTKID